MGNAEHDDRIKQLSRTVHAECLFSGLSKHEQAIVLICAASSLWTLADGDRDAEGFIDAARESYAAPGGVTDGTEITERSA